jgi:hypothetical protein
MDFIIDTGDDQAIDFSDLPLIAKRAIEYCKNIPDGKLVITRKIATDLKTHDSYLQKQTGGGLMNPYKIKHRGINLYGNPRTIAAYRRDVLGETNE